MKTMKRFDVRKHEHSPEYGFRVVYRRPGELSWNTTAFCHTNTAIQGIAAIRKAKGFIRLMFFQWLGN